MADFGLDPLPIVPYSYTIYQDNASYNLRNNWTNSVTSWTKGTTDFATVLEFAVNNLVNVGTGSDAQLTGGIFIMKGVYTATSQIDISFTNANRHGVSIKGEGWGTKISLAPGSALTNGILVDMNSFSMSDMHILANSNVGNIINLKGNTQSSQRNDNCHFENLLIQGPNGNLGFSSGPVISGQIGFKNDGTLARAFTTIVQHCYFIALDTGVLLSGTNAQANVIHSNHFLLCNIAVDIASGASQNTVDGAWIQGDVGIGIIGVRIGGTSNFNAVDNLITELHKTATASQAVLLQSGASNNRIGNRISNSYDGADALWKTIVDSSGNRTNTTPTNINVNGTNYIINENNITWFMANSQVALNGRFNFADTANTFNYTVGSEGALAASRNVLFPVLTANDTWLFQNQAQTITNKWINGENNTLVNVVNMPSVRKFGYWIPNGATVSASGLCASSTTNGITNGFDTTENVIAILTTGAVSGNQAYINNYVSGSVGVGRMALTGVNRSQVARAKIKSATSATSTRIYFGFSSNATASPALGDTPLSTAQSGVMVGYNSTDANWCVRTNNGGGGAATVTQFASPVTKDTAWHDIEIVINGTTNIVVNFDSTSATITTPLPATSANLFMFAYVETATSAARVMHLKYAQVEAV